MKTTYSPVIARPNIKGQNGSLYEFGTTKFKTIFFILNFAIICNNSIGEKYQRLNKK